MHEVHIAARVVQFVALALLMALCATALARKPSEDLPPSLYTGSLRIVEFYGSSCPQDSRNFSAEFCLKSILVVNHFSQQADDYRPDTGSVLFSTGRMDAADAEGFVEIPLPTYGSDDIRAMKERENDENPPPD